MKEEWVAATGESWRAEASKEATTRSEKAKSMVRKRRVEASERYADERGRLDGRAGASALGGGEGKEREDC